MSIAVLNQVYDETRRLAIAGSVVACGDFRLKKLIAPLEQAGTKAPVFAKAAEATKALVECDEKSSAAAILDVCTLVNAVLYTQGETGQAGDFTQLETTDLGPHTTQTSARLLKPLLEALTTTGSGRLEIIRDSHQRGVFRDLRLVKAALQALDDVYPEIADFVAAQVLPLYGKAILPELQSKFDLKGKCGHARRLILMREIDPVGTRELVKQALESGSKEVRVAAIECLGDDPEDLTFLLEQSTAKAKDVRAAALKSLAKLNDDQAVEALKNALTSTDLHLVVDPIHANRDPRLLKIVIDEAQKDFDNICKSKDKKAIAKSADRIGSLLDCLCDRDDKATEAFLLKCFDRREELLKVKDDDVGQSVFKRIGRVMSGASKKAQMALVSSHATLDPELLDTAFEVACHSMKPAEVYNRFSPYLTANVNEKKKDLAFAQRATIIHAITSEWRWSRWFRDDSDGSDNDDKQIQWDPRWLDLAAKMKSIPFVCKLARPGHAGANRLLSEMFAEAFKKSKEVYECYQVLETQARVKHPDATDNLIAVLEKYASPKAQVIWGGYNLCRIVLGLPKSAVPRLEELVPKLHEKVADQLVDYLTELKAKA